MLRSYTAVSLRSFLPVIRLLLSLFFLPLFLAEFTLHCAEPTHFANRFGHLWGYRFTVNPLT